jgi:fructosamine-3-kinase
MPLKPVRRVHLGRDAGTICSLMHARLAVIAVEGASDFGRRFVAHVADALVGYPPVAPSDLRTVDVVLVTHPILRPAVRTQIESAAARHLGSSWRALGFTDLGDRASHPCGVLHGVQLSVFAKFSDAPDAAGQFASEIAGLDLLRDNAEITVPMLVDAGVIELESGAVFITEALDEVAPDQRTQQDWEAIGRCLAGLHQVHAAQFGLDVNGHFGPLTQDNRPVMSDRWIDFYAERRLGPMLRLAVDSGHLPPDLASRIERLMGRLDALCGHDPTPTLLHGDAQANNFVSTASGAVFIDPAPFYGHPEYDLALVDCYAPVPDTLFDAYREFSPIDAGFEERRELWRLHAFLAVIAVEGASDFGRRFVVHVADVLAFYG